jgi:hypothetical protein
MIQFFAVSNLTKLDLRPCVPWEFVPPSEPGAKVRGDKQERQNFYRTASTDWNFYTSIEPANPNIRPSKENPPRLFSGFIADYDIKLSDERIDEAIAAMKIKPAWVERSLGGNARLVWTFPRPLRCDTYDFSLFILQQAEHWLSLGLLPALDSAAFADPSRLYCNGANWRSTGHGCVTENSLQAFFVECGRAFRFCGLAESAECIPLTVIEPAIREKFPTLDWPGEFALESQGPSFWIADSVSPTSAIVKPGGMFTFSAHAEKPFYSWADILGPEFVQQADEESIAKATSEIYWDGKHFWRLINGSFMSMAKDELLVHFEVECKMPKKRMSIALSHIHNQSRVVGAAPYVFRPMGRIEFHGKPVLNTYHHRIMPPGPELTAWGKDGKFPWLSHFLDNFFDPPEQLYYFLAWWKHFYLSGINMKPMPGQNTFLMGTVNIGKTLLNRAIVGRSVGGFMDASEYLTNNGGFNSELFEVPLWCVDDETMGESSATQHNFQAMLKKTAANQTFRFSKKFEVGALTEWMGRVLVTANLDYISSRALGPLDGSIADKTNVFRCISESRIIFPSRHELMAILERELPYLLRWLMDYEPPEYVTRDVRFGYKAYHEATMLDHSHQSSNSAPFKELLIAALRIFFSDNAAEKEWNGSVTQVMRLLQNDPLNDYIVRSFRVEQVNRYLESIQREQIVPCHAATGDMKTRVWSFRRFGDIVAETQVTPAAVTLNIFSK